MGWTVYEGLWRQLGPASASSSSGFMAPCRRRSGSAAGWQARTGVAGVMLALLDGTAERVTTRGGRVRPSEAGQDRHDAALQDALRSWIPPTSSNRPVAQR